MNAALRKPLGLILAGGGAHGAWQAAVVDHLERKYDIEFDHISCFSIGSLTGIAYLLDRVPKLVSIWKNISSHRILRLRPRLFPPTLYSAQALWELLRHAGTEEEAKINARCKLTSISFCRETQKHVYSTFSPRGAEGWHSPMGLWLLASCAIPQVFPPIRIDQNGETRTYVDGGVEGEEPLRFDALKDCKDVLVLQMTRPEELGAKPGFGYIARRLQDVREGLHRTISKGLHSLRIVPDAPRIIRFYPTKRLDYSMLDFRGESCIPAVYQGYHDADVLMSDLEAYME